MPISDGKTNNNHYLIGRGRLFFSAVNASGFPVGGYRDLGNVPNFALNVQSELFEHRSSRSGLKQIDKRIVVSQDVTGSFSLDEINLNNLALFLAGEVVSDSQGILSITGDKNLAVVEKGRWYDLYSVADMSATPYPTGNRVFNITSGSVVVTNDAGTTTYVLGTDYELDIVMGRIFIPTTSAIPAGTLGSPTLLDVDFAGVATTLERVRGLKVSEISGALKFIGENPANDGKQYEIQIHSATLAPDGDLGLISDEAAAMGMTFSAEKREAVDANSPTMTITEVAA